MQWTRYHDAEKFASIAEPIVMKQEDVFSLFLGVLQAIKQGKYKNPFLATVEEGNDILAIVQMTPPHPLNVVIVNESRMEEVIAFLIHNLVASNVEVPGVISLKPWASLFASEWCTTTGQQQKLLMDQGLYRLDEVDDSLQLSPGEWRFATEEDSPLIEEWITLFEEDTHLPKSPQSTVKERAATFIAAREIFLWVNGGEVVSMMKKARPTENSVTISLVFTPKAERKKGYARTMVLEGSKELLKDYQFCVLYTDMLNPTSNKIYQEIGYKRIADSVHIGFTEC
ncbi:GNAT family N-acetyltransferase [Sporosarcina saromensis]|uniref:GNAT family N-acetyltransferase n=1 Tax=Sporosarcina saromensis TaxID=359365 RepID=A0ABU4G8X4_9BACL|nr:GNAT family N-acetyltransferase [Sporosarcina saromensis]MDW0112780.1 GNAT family N-acetyltransferase [Sporosarcina saromensis]